MESRSPSRSRSTAATLGSVLVSGTNAININAQPTDKITLRNIQLQGIGSGLVGVKIFAAGVVTIENCVITQFTQQGISDTRSSGNTKLFIRNTVVSHNGSTGIGLGATGGNNAVIEETTSIGNLFGIAAATGNNAMVTRSVLTGNTTGVEADGGAVINVDNSSITGNNTGVQAGGTIRLSNSDVSLNNTGFSGAAVSYGNNRLLGNVSFGTAVSAAGGATNNLGEQ